MKLLRMSNNVDHAIVDDEDFERLSNFTWYINTSNIVRSIRVPGTLASKWRTLSNEVFQTKDELYDHKNRDFRDCQKLNLRLCTDLDNSHNRGKSHIKGGTSSKYKGVYFHAQRQRWFARIFVNKKCVSLGTFLTEDEAGLAYNKAAIEHFGEFACLNVI